MALLLIFLDLFSYKEVKVGGYVHVVLNLKCLFDTVKCRFWRAIIHGTEKDCKNFEGTFSQLISAINNFLNFLLLNLLSFMPLPALLIFSVYKTHDFEIMIC